MIADSRLFLADVSDIFYFFFCSGGGEMEEESEVKGGGTFHLEIERGRVSAEGRRRGVRQAWEGVVGRGGGLNIFFRGRNVLQVFQENKTIGKFHAGNRRNPQKTADWLLPLTRNAILMFQCIVIAWIVHFVPTYKSRKGPTWKGKEEHMSQAKSG